MNYPFENDTSAVIKKLARKSVRFDKKKNLFCLSAIIVAVAMIMMSLLTVQNIIYQNQKEIEGLHQGIFFDITQDSKEKLLANEEVKSVGLSCNIKTVKENSKELSLIYYDDDMLSLIPAFDGKYPEKASEIAVTDAFFASENKSPEINAIVQLNLDGTLKNYTIVGIYHDKTSTAYPVFVSLEKCRELRGNNLLNGYVWLENADTLTKDEATEISLEDAHKINKSLQLGDQVDVEIVPKDFGRIAAQTAKQVIVQKLREVERDIVFDEYSQRKGEIVSGIIQKADKNIVIMDLGKLEGIMLAKEKMPTENYRVNDKIKAYIVDVERGLKGAPQVMVSRSHPDFVRKLLEFEIPEIYEGLIEIKAVSRDPGYRSKVAVYSQDPNIDPVGSCVGSKGVRIQNVINELHGEKIDVIEWNQDPSIYIASALLPAKIMAVDIKEEDKFAQVIVPDDQLSLAIGKAGQNARLAAKLTSWKIDIKSESQFREMLTKQHEEEENDIQ